MDSKQDNRIEELQNKYFEFRFNEMEKELKRIRELLEESIKDSKNNFNFINSRLSEHDKKIGNLETSQRNCPAHSLRAELRLYRRETSFTRVMMKNPVRAFLTIGFVTLIVIISLVSIGFEPLIKLLTFFK